MAEGERAQALAVQPTTAAATTSSSSYTHHNNSTNYAEGDGNGDGRRKRPTRACRTRTWQNERHGLAQRSTSLHPLPSVPKKKPVPAQEEAETEPMEFPNSGCVEKERSQLRNMWELASILNFLHVFRPILNINTEFTAEELETALITSNHTLDTIHIPLLKGIPPINRTALRHDTWVTVLCKKLKYWWPWVGEGELPLTAYHGEEIATYKKLDPGIRTSILKALCDIRVEQDDTRKFIDDSLKHGVQIFTFRKERIGGSVNGTSYWYEDDSTIGHRLYREIRKVELKSKTKGKGRMAESAVSHQWETIATNLDEFQAVSEKLISSKNKAEAGLGKKLHRDILPVLEELQKMKERAMKRKQRQANLLDSLVGMQGMVTGRPRRDRKPVTYTFDEYDRSINEAIKTTTKSRPSPEPILRNTASKPTRLANGKDNGRLRTANNGYLQTPVDRYTRNLQDGDTRNSDIGDTGNSDMSSKFRDENGESDPEYTSSPLTRSNRPRRKPQRYSEKEYVEAYYDEEADFGSDDDIVGEAVYDDEYFKIRKHAKSSSNSDDDEEYRGDEDVTDAGDDEDASIGDDEDASISDDVEDSSSSQRGLSASARVRKGHKRQFVDERRSGLRRSKRATRIDYSKYEISDSDEEHNQDFENSARQSGRMNQSKNVSGSRDSVDYDTENEDSVDVSYQTGDEKQHCSSKAESPSNQTSGAEMIASSSKPVLEEPSCQRNRPFLDLNEAAPLAGFDDDPSTSGRNQTGVDDIGYSSSRQ